MILILAEFCWKVSENIKMEVNGYNQDLENDPLARLEDMDDEELEEEDGSVVSSVVDRY
jgi:hypothetical protein